MHGCVAAAGLQDALRREMLPFGVSVSLVSPGYVNTAIQDKNADTAWIASQMTTEQQKVGGLMTAAMQWVTGPSVRCRGIRRA